MNTELEELLHSVRDQVEFIGSNFTDPDEEWIPVAFAVSDGGTDIFILDPKFFNSPATKQALTEALTQKIEEDNVKMFAFVMTCYALSVEQEPGTDPEAARERLPKDFSEHPDSVETLMIQVFDADDYTAIAATIERTDDAPPKLAEWQEAKGMMGQLTEPFRDALKIARRQRSADE